MSDHKPPSEASKKDRVLEFQKMKGAHALAVLDPSKEEKDQKDAAHKHESTPKLDSSPVCMTQDPVPPQFGESDPLQIFIGLFTSIARWKKGKTVNFAAYANGYPAAGDAVYAANQLNKAALEWNSHNIGVQFQWVGKLEDAAFVLAYGGEKGNVVASAYFPNSNDLNTVYVYKRAFDTDTKPYMWRFFLHELGHVIGLRHEFAMDIDPATGKPKEGGAVQFGRRNSLSVMNYRPQPPVIQQSDIDDTKAFYNFTGTSFGGMRIQDFVPDN